MKALFRQPQPGLSGYVALLIFLLAYSAIMAVLIAPDQVKAAMDAPWIWPFQYSH